MVFDRFKERVRQGTGISKDLGNFKGTDNARVEKMLSEADDFAHRLKSYKKYLKEQNSATKDLLESTHKTLSVDLPKVYDRDPEGKAAGQFNVNNSHTSVNIHNLSDLTTRFDAEIKTQVVGPIDQWLEAHKEMGQKLSKLNNFRLDLDTARRNHNRSDLQRVRQQQKHDNVEPTLMGKLQEQATELDGKRDAWTQYESEVHAELMNLVNEAASMHVHLARAFAISANVYGSALASDRGSSLASAGNSGAFRTSGLSQALPSSGGSGGITHNLSHPEYVQRST